MARKPGYACRCESCREERNLGVVAEHRQLNLLLDRLDERQRRWLAAREAMKLGHGGFEQMATITGMHPETIRRGRDELHAELADCPVDRIRRPGGGRPRLEKKILR